MMTHWLLAVGFAGMAVAIFFLGWSARIMRVEWRDDRALRAAEARYERHTHRKGDPLPALPTAGWMPIEDERPRHEPAHDPEVCLRCRFWALRDSQMPPWLFAGESAPGWGSESAEYELLTQTVEQPAVGSLDWTAGKVAEVQADERETDSGFTKRMAREVDEMIAGWQGDTNYLMHIMRAES